MHHFRLFGCFGTAGVDGPLDFLNYSGKPKLPQEKAKELFLEWEEGLERKRMEVIGSESVQQACDQHKKAPNQACMSKAMEAAKNTLAAQRARLTIQKKT